MRKYDSKIKEIQKRNSTAESNKEGRDMLIGMLFGGVFLFVAPVWFFAFLIATLTSSMEAWKVTGVCTLIFAVMVGLFSISNKLYKKDLKKNAQLNKETMKEILAEEVFGLALAFPDSHE